jgi:hypothetical protein
MIPHSYDEWKKCIVEDCKIKLSQDFVARRLKIYHDKNNPETRQFVKLYGEPHLNNIIYWLERCAKEIRQR